MEEVLLNGEVVYLKKGWFGWGVVYPWRNPDNNEINWFNLLTGGSWLNLIMVIVIVVLLVGAIIEYTSNINILISCFDNFENLEVCKRSFGNLSITIKP